MNFILCNILEIRELHGGMVYDACAGPTTGSQTEAAYVASTIDHSTSAEAAAAGDTSDISTKTIGTIN